ncbi:DUF3025 domain-containing protein [Salinimonas chungwhensis]|uniref:DUF3025 domain-containing protein n=1 Tax=Salinimonas chungwhensis TaxID=265425 RepID=UPI000684B625|nr:DUF3025 domain-containing protein [Salinimonas chungwhensis]
MNSNGANWPPVSSDSGCSFLVTQLLTELKLNRYHTFPSPQQLSSGAVKLHNHTWTGPNFVAQAAYDNDESRYYEQIISQDACVPTRENSWHDLFNACIWMQYPATKWRLNQLHVHDIRQAGLHPRTRRRNHITHFDECGVILAIPENRLGEGNEILNLLANHQWQSAFLTHKNAWDKIIFPRVFGHANYEMLLSPFIGLTGKWLAVTVPADFDTMSNMEQLQALDSGMLTQIDKLANFSMASALPPLPLLGVPGWHFAQDGAFYANQDYFRPKRSVAPTPQLPLTSAVE